MASGKIRAWWPIATCLLLMCLMIATEIYILYMIGAGRHMQQNDETKRMVGASMETILEILASKDAGPTGPIFDEVYVIALPCRKEYIAKSLETFGIREVTYVEPVMKGALSEEWVSERGLVSALAYNHPKNFGRIACHLSHLNALQMFLADPALQTALIFEDDIKPCCNPKLFENRMRSLKGEIKQLREWDVIYLGHCYTACVRTKARTRQLFATKTSKCRHAYGVTRRGALKILEGTLPMWGNGDVMMMRMSADARLTSLAVIPSLFVQNKAVLGSTLGNMGFKVCSDTDQLNIETVGGKEPACPIIVFTRFSVFDATHGAFGALRSRQPYKDALFSVARLDYKFRGFERVTLPSILAQTHANWHWYIYISPLLPAAYRERLERGVPATHGARISIVVASSMADVDRHRQAVMARRARENFITVRLDDDDGLSPTHFSILTKYRNFYGSVVSLPDGRKYTMDDSGEVLLGDKIYQKNTAVGLAAVNMDVYQCGNHLNVNDMYNVIYDGTKDAYMKGCSEHTITLKPM